jgi:hypothetical protein
MISRDVPKSSVDAIGDRFRNRSSEQSRLDASISAIVYERTFVNVRKAEKADKAIQSAVRR